jgi:small nuclear ribonucleoprotein (snRNP)-like protein
MKLIVSCKFFDQREKKHTFIYIFCGCFIFFLVRILVVLRDGRTLIGILRSVDQFANLILHQAVERIHVGRNYGDIPRGVFLVRGDNITIIGEIVCIFGLKKLHFLKINYNNNNYYYDY